MVARLGEGGAVGPVWAATICGLVSVLDALSPVGGAGHLSLNCKVAVKVASGMGSEKKNWRCGPEFGHESNSSWVQAEVSTALLAGGWGARGDTGFWVLRKITESVARAGCWLRVSDICWAEQMGRASGACARKVAAKFGGPPAEGSWP